MAEGDTVEY